MNAKRWIALAAAVIVEIIIAGVVFRMWLEENCNNSIPRWQCNESLENLLVGALIAIPALYLTLLVVAAVRAWVERRESSTPN